MGWKDLLGVRKKIAVFVDGQNVFSDERHIDLLKVKKEIQQYGLIVVAVVFLSSRSPLHLEEKINAIGFQTIKRVGNIDSVLTVEAMEKGIFKEDIDMFVLVSGDAGFFDLLHKAQEYGKRIMVVGFDGQIPECLKNVAEWVSEA